MLTEGELWTREQLALLRADHFSAAAMRRFLGASGRRSAAVRTARPRLARQARCWQVGGASLWLAGAAIGAEPLRRCLARGVGWWIATALMLDWHLGMLETEGGRPQPLTAADALTLARAWLVPIAADAPNPAVFAVAGLTDVFDGLLARRGEPTRAGRDLEGLVDLCFFLAGLHGARRHGALGAGPANAERTRLVAGAAFSTLIYFGRARAPDRASMRAARAASVVRVGALMVAGLGRRRAADVLMVWGTGVSVALLVRQVSQSGLSPGVREPAVVVSAPADRG